MFEDIVRKIRRCVKGWESSVTGFTVCMAALLDRFLEDACPKVSPELLALAEEVRAILAACNPDDPAVTVIRESAAYKQAAWLIEPEPAGQPVQ